MAHAVAGGAVERTGKLAPVGDHDQADLAGDAGGQLRHLVDHRAICRVTHRRHDRHGAAGGDPAQLLVVERRQVRNAAAAARDDDHVNLRDVVERHDRPDQRRRRIHPLHDRGAEDDPGGGESLPHAAEHVVEGVGGIAAHQPDLAREARQWPAWAVHEPLALEPLDDRLAPAQQLALADVHRIRAQQRQPAVGGIEVRPVDLHEQPLSSLHRAAQ